MTVEEIRKNITMSEILTRYGIRIRNNMCKCPFHGDNSPSMKVFKDGCHCFTCVKSWDVFSFTQDMEHCDFKTAFKMLGGSYKAPQSKESKILSDRKFKALREAKQRAEHDRRIIKQKILFSLNVLQEVIRVYEPFSETWCDAQNDIPVFYDLLDELTAGREIDKQYVIRRSEAVRNRYLVI